jgi:hypothetical protein
MVTTNQGDAKFEAQINKYAKTTASRTAHSDRERSFSRNSSASI